MRTVWKFVAGVEAMFTLSLPAGAELLHVAVQGGLPCIWVLCDADADKVERRFITATTGQPLYGPGRELTHVGSYLLGDGAFVGHIFEVGAVR